MSTRITDTASSVVDAPASVRRRGPKFSARELLNVAIFAVIFIVVTYAIGMLRAADALLSLPVVGSLALAIAVSGLVGGLFGSAMLRKHFVRAGLA